VTLVVALICSDGILMAADGQTTFPTEGGYMRLPSEKKIRPLGDRLLWAGAGDVGLLQKIGVVLEQPNRRWDRPIGRMRPEIRGVVHAE
jgi:20S proteasome alpha/beta subunit